MVQAQHGTLPALKSYYDFEGSNGEIKDNGPAENNGEIMGDEVSRSGDGIITKAGDSGSCLEFEGEPMNGALSYVAIPYADFHNATNYTFTAWVKWTPEEPNYGYVFWQGGPVWPEEDQSRHVDLWLHLGNASFASGLHDVNDAAVTQTPTGTVYIFNGEWHLVGLTLAENKLVKLWIDGAMVSEIESSEEIKENNEDELWLGARPNGEEIAVKMVGLMDRVRIWDVALDADQMDYLSKIEGPDGGSVEIVGITENRISNIEIYPNPVVDEIHINSVNQINKVSLLGISGKVLKTFNDVSQQFVINVKDIAPGVYFIKTENANGIIETQKIIK